MQNKKAMHTNNVIVNKKKQTDDLFGTKGITRLYIEIKLFTGLTAIKCSKILPFSVCSAVSGAKRGFANAPA